MIRTITLLRYLPEPALRDQITMVTNRTENFHKFAAHLTIGGQLISHNDPDYQERVVKFNELMSNCAIYSTALDITDAANALAAEGHPVDLDDLATISPYITRTIRRFGDWIVDLAPPADAPATRLDLEPRVLFATGASDRSIGVGGRRRDRSFQVVRVPAAVRCFFDRFDLSV